MCSILVRAGRDGISPYKADANSFSCVPAFSAVVAKHYNGLRRKWIIVWQRYDLTVARDFRIGEINPFPSKSVVVFAEMFVPQKMPEPVNFYLLVHPDRTL